MKLKRWLTFAVASVSVCAVAARAEDYRQAVEKGNQLLQAGKTKEALEQYYMAETKRPESPEIEYNIAGAMYREGRFEEAEDRYTKSLNAGDADLAAAAYYNLGNTYYRAGDYLKAITSYQHALELKPDDMDAKFNLELARKMLKENSKPQKSQDQKQQQQQKKQDQQKQQNQQQQQQEQQQKNQEGQQQQKQDEQKQQQKKQAQQGQKMSKEDAERILNALKDDEKDVQKKARRVKATGAYVGKDW